MFLFARMRKVLSVAVILAMSLSAIPVASALETSNDDTQGHWAQDDLRKWVASGLLQGYDDGSIQPDRPVTRAELMTLINRSFKLNEKETVSFTDLSSSNWASEQVAIAVKAGYVKGYEDGTIRWNQQVTREEAASMVADLLQVDDTKAANVSSFKDASSIGGWSEAAIAALVDAGIMNGYPNGNFVPKGKFTRAESVTVLEKALDHLKPAVEYSTAGVYGPETGTETIKGNVVVSAPGVTLQNLIIEGSLTLTAAVGEGDVHLNKVTVKGTTTIAGGGKNSVHLKDSVLVNITVNKKDGTVRIVAEGSTAVQSVTLQSATIVEESGLTGTGFTAVQLAKELPANTEVKLVGSFSDVNVYSAAIRLDVESGSIGSLVAHESAEGVAIHVDAAAKVAQLVLDAVAKLTGQGAIEKAVVNKGGENTSFEKQPAKVEGEGAATEVPGAIGGDAGGGSVIVPNPAPTENVYEITSDIRPLHIADVDTLAVDAINKLVDSNGNLVVDPMYFFETLSSEVGIRVKQNIGKHYAGNVRLIISGISASNGGQADGLQLFAYDQTSSTYTDIVKAGFGAADGQTIESLMSDFAHHTSWNIVAKPGNYFFKIQIVNVSTRAIVAESALQQVQSYNAHLKSLSVDGYTLKKRTAYPEQIVGEGFDPNHIYYEILVPNTVDEVILRPETAVTGANVTVVLERMLGYDAVTSQNDGEGKKYFQIPLKAGQHEFVTIENTLPSGLHQIYSVLIRRLPKENTGAIDPNNPGVAIPVYGNNMSGASLRLVTAQEIAAYNEKSIFAAQSGIALTLDKENLPEAIRNFAYLKFEPTGSISDTVNNVSVMPYHGIVYDSAGGSWTMLTFKEFSGSNLSSYYRVVFYDRNDNPLGVLYITSSPLGN